MATIVPSRESENQSAKGEPGIQLPATVTPIVAAAPISDASTTRPLRKRYMYSPTRSAIGTVQAIVNVPQELPGTACETPPGNVIFPFAAANAGTAASAGWASFARDSVKPSLRVTALPLEYVIFVPGGMAA